jgi:hypothetical protein
VNFLWDVEFPYLIIGLSFFEKVLPAIFSGQAKISGINQPRQKQINGKSTIMSMSLKPYMPGSCDVYQGFDGLVWHGDC